MKTMKTTVSGVILAMTVLGAGQAARAYVDLAPSLAKITSDAPTIAVVEVTAYDRAARTVTFKPAQTLKGTIGEETFAHQVSQAGNAVPRQIVQWAVPGSQGIIFQTRTAQRGSALMCFGTGWYQVTAVGTGAWKMGAERPDLPLAYYGSVGRLKEAVTSLLKGQPAVISVVAYGNEDAAASFDLALNRQSLPGVVKLQRIRVSGNSSGSTMGSGGFIGNGVVDERDLPQLMEKLKSKEAIVRAQAAEDLRTLKRKAKAAGDILTGLLKDENPRVRNAAASALLQGTPRNKEGVTVLLAGMSDKSAVVRHWAADAAGYCGKAGEPFTEPLAKLLADPDEGVRLTALESLSMLGAVAEKAVPALIPLLDDKELVCDVADALGRIGPGASAALPKLAEVLKSDQKLVQWAAVRGMSQIGGAGARPAMEYMVKVIQSGTATEVEGYNIMIYMSMLGPGARDALPALQNFAIKNPFLPNTTYWAMYPTTFPWLAGGGGGMGGGRGGRGGGGMGGMMDFMYAAYVKELGPRLASLAPALAKGIMENSAGEVPTWGYGLLNAAPAQSLALLMPWLTNSDLLLRERAAVAIGYMGEEGEGAVAAVKAALGKAANEREKKLLEWTLRQIE